MTSVDKPGCRSIYPNQGFDYQDGIYILIIFAIVAVSITV